MFANPLKLHISLRNKLTACLSQVNYTIFIRISWLLCERLSLCFYSQLKKVFFELPHKISHFYALFSYHRHHAFFEKNNLIKLFAEGIEFSHHRLFIDSFLNWCKSISSETLIALISFMDILFGVIFILNKVSKYFALLFGMAEGDAIIAIHAFVSL